MSKMYTVEFLAKELAKSLRMKEWRIDKITNKEDLVGQIDRLERTLEVAKELVKEAITP